MKNVDEYIDSFDAQQQRLLKSLRAIIKKAAPKATEVISYKMPTFKQHRNLIHFAAYENHIGLYPGPEAIQTFAGELTAYKTTKGAIQFPLDKPIPGKLVTEIVKHQVKKDEALTPTTSIDYSAYQKKWAKEIDQLLNILRKSGLKETTKWGIPAFTYQGNNVAGVAGFKNHFALWFYNGVFLKDKYQKLVNAQEGKTKSMRQWRFDSADEISEKQILEYIKEAVDVEKKGLKMEPAKSVAIVSVPELLQQVFKKNKALQSAFEKLTPGRRKDYIVYINEAKQEATKQSRIDKITPMILNGVGLNDRYK